MSGRSFRLCADTGGTFTDLVALDGEGNLSEFKVPSTPADFADGVLDAIDEASCFHGRTPRELLSETELIVHGTTVATNALVTRSLARPAMLTTKGFRDIIEMRRCLKIETKSMYQALIPPYEPVVPRHLRLTVDEETRYTGEVVKPVDTAELARLVERLKADGVQALAVCFINSYANPENERRAAEFCQEALGDVFVTYSCGIVPKMGEYERQSTCVISAAVGPVVTKYIIGLDRRLRDEGFTGQLLIMQANQLMQSVAAVIKKPVYLIVSGPAAAPPGAAYLSGVLKDPNLITADMGGTTLDVALIKDAEVPLVDGRWFGDDRVGIKVVDVSSIGAGGGSIAWFDPLGLLQVGPQSAGADPGPACYGRGGTEPTVTDAAVVLGYLPADFFCGGSVPLDVELARAAVKKIGDRMRLPIEEAAQAVFTTVNSNMVDELMRISTRMGHDVREFSLLACGGGGPMCGAFWGDLLGCRSVIVPNHSSSFCAFSMLTLDIGRDYLRSYVSPLDKANASDVNLLYQEMLEEGLSELEAFQVNPEEIIVGKSADLRYHGQYHDVEIQLPPDEITPADLEASRDAFQRKHTELYTFDLPWVPIEIRNLRLLVKVKGRKLSLPAIEQAGEDPGNALKRTRRCFFNGGLLDTLCFDSTRLKANNVVRGPALIEAPTTTAVIPPGFRASVDAYNNYVLQREV
ncbi:MAG: hydantoinase/oxoprolinase family protein [Actinobacteria bacterium]|nr:hydantoinase/oxoprolinase family protein [Actinomycetota bacterium]